MGFGKGGWQTSNDGSRMKVTHDEDKTVKTERISSAERPHDHDIVIVHKDSGRVEEISVGKHFPRTRDNK